MARHRELLAATLLLASLGRPAAASPAHVVVLGEDPGPSQVVSHASFVLALKVQLAPYSVEVEADTWVAPTGFAQQRREARRRGARRRALAVVWWTLAAGDPPTISGHVIDLRSPPRPPQTLSMPADAGVERSMAVALRTLLRAPLVAARAAATTRPAAPTTRPAAAGVAVAPLVRLGAFYALDVLPLGGEVRHGPEISGAFTVWRRIGAEVAVGLRLIPDEQTDDVTLGRSAVHVAGALVYRWPLPRRFAASAGVRGQLSAIFVRAAAAASGSTDRDQLWELCLAAHGSLALRLGGRARARVWGSVGWLPLPHRVLARGVQITDPGRLTVQTGAGVEVGFW